MKKKDEKLGKNFGSLKNMPTFAVPKRNNGVIAQLVEQRTENPCVPGSIPGDTTKITKSESKKSCSNATLFFIWHKCYGRHMVQLCRYLSGIKENLCCVLS